MVGLLVGLLCRKRIFAVELTLSSLDAFVVVGVDKGLEEEDVGVDVGVVYQCL